MLKLYGDEVTGQAGGERKFEPFVPRASQKVRGLILHEENVYSPQSEQPTGEESLVEQWILQKLNHAAAAVNKALEERNFMAASSKCYDFWLYEVCDVFIVRRASLCSNAALTRERDVRRKPSSLLPTLTHPKPLASRLRTPSTPC
jgi:valyl-tRNA synthetase